MRGPPWLVIIGAMTPAVLTTALLAMASVSLWTLRVALTARNHKAIAVVAASVEATVSVLAFSRILTSLDSVVQVAAYAVGVGCGTLVGLAVNDRLSPTTKSANPNPAPVDEFGVRTVALGPTPEPAGAPITMVTDSLLADDLKALIADWDVLEGSMSAPGEPSDTDTTPSRHASMS